jgi:putative DNA primase/helicase
VLTLRNLAHALRGEVVGGQVLCPGPGHSPRDRSLSIKLSGADPAGFTCFSHAGDDFRACRDYVKRALSLRDQPRPHDRAPGSREETHGEDDRQRRMREAALALFAQTIDVRGTLGERYLAEERGLPGVIDDEIAKTIRFHRSCAFKDEAGRIVEAPAIICAVRDVADIANVSAVQRMRLTPDGKKIERRSLGPMLNGAVLCCPTHEIKDGRHLTIAEGVETALAMRKLGFQGCVALCSVSRFRAFELPPGIRSVTISGENDGGASEAAWRAAGERWARAGVEVEVWAPPETDDAGKPLKDANDLLKSLFCKGRAR